ncbi:MAG: aspartyl-tRNA(Asn)/glutamyl-tRNA(Gln) amidotransferase subunit B [Rhodothermales bacterium]|jgi:aspartyl-tRNA(Asn)/glutamyl-tRNA(Gln) amidotransferase subunit B
MKYESVIGLEVHIQVRTNTKMFCACPNCMMAPPNTLICPVCMGYPGVLPTPNEEAIQRTILAGMMIDCEIPLASKFDRKSYFYPDMPKNYQLTQYDMPLCGPGKLRIEGKGLTGEVTPRDIRINRIHLEEDVGKSSHVGSCSGIDYNRAGVPLMEIVSEADLRTADEAYCYLQGLRRTMQYAGISDCDMEKGQMRCDVNISVRPVGQEHFNLKTELKNLNSFKNVHHSIDYEFERQVDVLEEGGELWQATWGWNADRGVSYELRSKEDAHDYRYFPDPDLMPLALTEERIAKIRATLPETPAKRRDRFVSEYGLPEYDAGVLTAEKAYAEYYEAAVKAGGNPKKTSNWIMSELLRELSQANTDIADCPITAENLAALLGLVDKGTINGKIAKEVFAEMFESGKAPAAIVKERGLEQVADSGAIAEFVQAAISANPGPVAEYKEGKGQALNFLVGQVMKASRGKANPQLAVQAIKAALD